MKTNHQIAAEVGFRLKEWRLRRQHYTGQPCRQEDVAQAVGIAQATYSRIESGKSLMNLGQMLDLCEYFDGDVWQLLDAGGSIRGYLSQRKEQKKRNQQG